MILANPVTALLRPISLGVVLAMVLIGATHAVAAEDTDPEQARLVLEQVASEMIRSTNELRKENRNNPEEIEQLVEKVLLPHIDLITASRWVLGKHWRQATKEQKIEFIKHFRGMLLRFYSTALSDYLSRNSVDENLIQFYPVRAEAGSDDVTVRSEVRPPEGQPVPVNYHMHLTRKGWKVYDVSVEGVSVITTYRNSFNEEIRRNGLDQLIARLADKNDDINKVSPGASG